MSWELSDPYAVEEDLEAIGPEIATVWYDQVKPELLRDPTPSNPRLAITLTHSRQVWLPDTDVFVRFELLAEDYVLLIAAVDILRDGGDHLP